MIIIGITGGIASGKSKTSQYIKSLGYKLYDCDKIAHDIFDSNEVKKEIASTLNISEKTVRNHISNVMQKLEVASRTAALVELLKLNELEL